MSLFTLNGGTLRLGQYFSTDAYAKSPEDTMNQLLIVSAVRFEIEPLLAIMPSIESIECGIGALNTARQHHTLCEAARGKHVLYIGTCGVYGSFHEVQLCQSDDLHWVPLCERLGQSWAIEGLELPVESGLSPLSLELPLASIVCCQNIAKTDALAPDVLGRFRQPLLVENLESYCVAKAVRNSAKSFTGILGITNQIGLEARKEWRQHFQEAAKLTAEYLAPRLSSFV